MCKLSWRWKVKPSLMKEGYYLVPKSAHFMFFLVTTGPDLAHLGTVFLCIRTNACKLHFLSKYGIPVMVLFGNSVNTSWPNRIAHLLICPGSRARARDPWLPDFWLQQGQDAQHANMWRLSVKLWITKPLHLLNVCVCVGNGAKVFLTSMMVDKKHCCQLSEG